MIDIRVLGLDATANGLRSTADRLERTQKAAMADITLFARDATRGALLNIAEQRTGKLHRGIRRSVRESGGEVIGQVVAAKKQFYWRFVEHGTEFAREHPFVEPTLERHGDDIVDAVDRQVIRALVR